MSQALAVETATEDLLTRVEDGIAVLTMNRPERRNALSPAMLEALGAALEAAERDHQICCVVLTGAGGAFCAGGDVKAMAEGGGADLGIDTRIHLQRLSQRNTSGRLYQMPKPTIAAIPGAAAGAGLSLALACDFRIVAEDAVMTTAFAKVGFSGDYGGTFFLTQLVGSTKARELYYLSDRFTGAEAAEMGIANKAVPGEQLEAETMALARRIASGPAVAYRYMKENLNRAVGGEAIECMDLEATHHVHCGQTEDHRNATKAFVERRDPVFKGR